jgi:hypothetical protein
VGTLEYWNDGNREPACGTERSVAIANNVVVKKKAHRVVLFFPLFQASIIPIFHPFLLTPDY